MTAALGFLLSGISLGRLCAVYFFLAPVFLSREDLFWQNIVFAAGYAFSGGIAFLALAERLSSCAENIRYREYTPIILGLIGACFLTIAINSPNKLLSTTPYYFKYLKLILPVAAFFVMINIWTYRDLPKLYFLLIAMGLLSMVGLVPEIASYISNPSGAPRFSTYFKEANRYALFINILYGMALPDLIASRLKGRGTLGLACLVVLLVLVLFLTQSRGGIFMWGVLTALAFWPKSARGLFLKFVPILIPLCALLGAAVVARYLGRESNANLSDLQRVWTYIIGFQIVSSNPLTGIGYANIIDYCNNFGGVYRVLMSKGMAIHNATLEIWAETGLFGMILYLTLTFGPIRALVKRMNRRAAEGEYPALEVAAVSIPIAFFCFGLFCPNYLADDYFWCYMSFTFVALRSQAPRDFVFTLPAVRWI